MATYLITEEVLYSVEAESEEEALERFLASPDPDFIAVNEREIALAPDQP